MLSSLSAFFRKRLTVSFIREQIWELLAALFLQLCARVLCCKTMRTYRGRQSHSLTNLALFAEAAGYKWNAEGGAEVEPGCGFWNETFISVSLCAGVVKGIR